MHCLKYLSWNLRGSSSFLYHLLHEGTRQLSKPNMCFPLRIDQGDINIPFDLKSKKVIVELDHLHQTGEKEHGWKKVEINIPRKCTQRDVKNPSPDCLGRWGGCLSGE